MPIYILGGRIQQISEQDPPAKAKRIYYGERGEWLCKHCHRPADDSGVLAGECVYHWEVKVLEQDGEVDKLI